MVAHDHLSPDTNPQADRRTHILDAAQRCFVRAGFHRTTMQEVAAEAGMSPGNLYRYFPSKDAIVAGLSERDRTEIAQHFSELAHSDNFMETFGELGRRHFRDQPRERAILCLEIWAEATRNPDFAKMCAHIDKDVQAHIMNAFRHAQAKGDIPAHVDIDAVAFLISLIADGMFVHRAVSPNFDYERDVGLVLRLIGAMVRGEVQFPPKPSPENSCKSEQP
jgi:TetR/AcrR family transcriptional repressor of uid operon